MPIEARIEIPEKIMTAFVEAVRKACPQAFGKAEVPNIKLAIFPFTLDHVQGNFGGFMGAFVVPKKGKTKCRVPNKVSKARS